MCRANQIKKVNRRGTTEELILASQWQELFILTAQRNSWNSGKNSYWPIFLIRYIKHSFDILKNNMEKRKKIFPCACFHVCEVQISCSETKPFEVTSLCSKKYIGIEWKNMQLYYLYYLSVYYLHSLQAQLKSLHFHC